MLNLGPHYLLGESHIRKETEGDVSGMAQNLVGAPTTPP